ncbi:MAG: cache domain-containing protein [Candidatus Sulfobium sp.]|jgi:hypothetical protein
MKMVRIVVLFLMVSVPAFAAELKPAAVNKTVVSSPELRLLLNSFVALGEGHVEHVLNTLKLMSSTREVQSGKWEDMKSLLTEFNGRDTTVVALWFVRPDGSYYAVDKGLTGLSLRDRPYFPGLMSGKDVTGDLVISKSTGKRSAIVAVPVKRNGRIIGGLGASLSVRTISKMIDRKMALPEGLIFYAIDAKGLTSLHRVSTLLFAYPSDMGSRTLRDSVAEMLSKPEGEVKYDFYGERTVVYRRSPLTGWVYALGVATGKPVDSAVDLPPFLLEMEKEVTSALERMNRDVAAAAEAVSKEGLEGPRVRRILKDLCSSHPYAVDCSAVDPEGTMVVVEPEKYAEFEGSDIGSQEQIIRLHKSKKPVLGTVIRSVEGFDAVDFEYPIFSPGGGFAGSVSMLIRPEMLLESAASSVVQGMPVDVWVMQKDGRILYDPDKEEVGRMLFEDPIYKPFPQLLALGRLIAGKRKGTGSYEFLGRGLKRPVRKDAYWTTVGLGDTEWRVVLTHAGVEGASTTEKSGKEVKTLSSEGSLRRMAGSDYLTAALSANDTGKIRTIFKKFYSEYGGLYSVQWVDARGINRYGYPEENSLVDVDFNTLDVPSSKYILKAISERGESSFDCRLAEGKEGSFFMVPVHEGDRYLGMLYTIRIRH